jgi:hypothetical protein
MTQIAQAAQKVLELVGNLSLIVIVPTIGVFLWTLLFKGEDEEEDWTVNLAVSVKIGAIFLLIAVSIILNAAGDKIWLLMREERLWGLYILLLFAGTALVSLLMWLNRERLGGIQSLDALSNGDAEAQSRPSRVPVAASCISLSIGWSVAIVWLWSISKGA